MLNTRTNLNKRRARFLKLYGASALEIEELLVYGENKLATSEPVKQWSLTPEPSVVTWQQYVDESADQGVFATLKTRLPQLQFPIQLGISDMPAYRAATRRGSPAIDPLATGLSLRHPDKLRLWLHSTLVGTIPVLLVGDRQDFVSLVQALTLRNEPKAVPDSMGACIVAGFNNWDRVRQYRQQWEQKNPTACSESDWSLEFQRLIPQKSLYQDRLIILSEGPYSNVSAHNLGLADKEWNELSLLIRLEHECTHYLTHRLFGFMRNHLLDELLADYRGIIAAIGDYRADWFFWFVGLEDYPIYREGGRLQNYRGNPPLSIGAFRVLQALVKDAAKNLEKFHIQHSKDLKNKSDHVQLLIALTQLTLEELADPTMTTHLEAVMKNCRQSLEIS